MPIQLLGLQSGFSSVIGVSHNGGTWFISCIIVCYIIYPLIYQFIEECRLKKSILFVIAVFLVLYMPIYAVYSKSSSLYTNPFFRLMEFTVGVILAEVWKDGGKKNNLISIIMVMIFSGGLLTLVYNKDLFLIDFSIVFVCGIIYFAANIENKKLEKCRSIFYLSSLTYCFYIFQLLVWKPSLKLISILQLDNSKFNFIVTLTFLLLICVVVHEFYEKPIKKYLGERFYGVEANK